MHAKARFIASLALLAATGLSACGQDVSRPLAEPPPAVAAAGVHYRELPSSPKVPVVSAGGVHSASVSCSTCHSMMAPNPARKAGDELVRFHKDAHVAHGNLTCLSCHNESDYDSLRLADGTAVEFGDVMTLCAQCHGTQARDYEHGVHGGATGYWDTTRGPQVRNQCTHCHAPHAPTYKRMQPTFKPRDRFLYPKPSAATSTQVREDDR